MYYSAICTESDCYKASRLIEPQGIILHSVGCNQSRASVFVALWNKPGVKVLPHAVIDGSGDIYQTLPFNRRGWHAGGKANNTHIGVEMCEPSTLKYDSPCHFTVEDPADMIDAQELAGRTYHAAVQLFADLCVQYGLDPREPNVILSHTEAHDRGLASDHGDPEELWRGIGLSYDMSHFRWDVYAALMERSRWTVKIPSFTHQADAERVASLLREAGIAAQAVKE